MKYLYLLFPLAIVSLMSCNQTQNNKEATTADSTIVEQPEAGADVPFTEARNYFVNNTVGEDKNGTLKIETQEAFNELFSPATTMGEGGMPTEIDFNKQFVIAVISPTSDLNPSIDSLSLKKINSDLVLEFKETMGDKQSFSTRPAAILIVDKQFDGNLKADVKSTL
ncbi:hypothetical protein [Sphingobacterium daejeonense]|uniref:hypothetical protein n=1 Tax=Sphingobacterium daejeonense TaxID=371142 RepID=UPI0010C52FC4|nr:hypothetical protein [Sphingobacterium daejeonense]VTP97407.1 Uncharacterised protein [Sphingobacterium daejeonense]